MTTGFAEGLVVRTDAKVVHVLVGGEVRQFVPRGKLFDARGPDEKNPIAVGDRVRVSLAGNPPGVEEVLARKNHLPRIASSHDPREQVLFANVDQMVVIGSLEHPRFSSNRTDRILVACRYHEIPARLVLNKTDLGDPADAVAIARTYAAADVPVLRTNAVTGAGLDELAELLRGKTSAFYGASGAGKSTLLNALQPGLKLKIGNISRYWAQGKHTTTFSQMLRLDALEAWAIDTPGIRVFRLFGINQAELRDCFPEIARLAGRCRFSSCSHDHEPDCAVFDAVEAGEIAPTRYQSYVEILDELAPPPPDVETVVPPEG
jgi:ribosome biogenesis GTPase